MGVRCVPAPLRACTLCGDPARLRRVVHDKQALCRRALALLGDAGRRDELRERGLQVAARYDWSNVAREVLEVYETVTVGGGKVREDVRGQALGKFNRLSRGGTS